MIYIYKKDPSKRYELIQQHLLYKREYVQPTSYEEKYAHKVKYEWDKKPTDLILYKALYENHDGPFFVRHSQDFFDNFIPEDEWEKSKIL